MASATIQIADKFPDGTLLSAYVRSTQGESQNGPSGTPVATATTNNGVATFSGLTEDERYTAWGQVAGQWKRQGFIVNNDPEPVFVKGVEVPTKAQFDALKTAIENLDLSELNLEGYATTDDLSAHASDTSSVHGVSDTTALATDSDLSTHAADTTSVHGITNTASLATQSYVTSAVSGFQSDLDALAERVTILEGGSSLPHPGRWYANDSPWNTPIGDNPSIHANSAAIVNTILNGIPGVNDDQGVPTAATANVIRFQCGTAWDQWDYEHPIFFAKDTDPLKSIVGGNNDGQSIRVPADAWVSSHPTFASGGDCAMAVVQPDGSTYEFWGVSNIGTTSITCAWGDGPNNIYTGSGWNSDGGGATITLARAALGAGMLRYDEMVNGIYHALFFVTYNYSGYQSPAMAGNQGARRRVVRSDVPKMGMRLRLNLTDNEIAALPSYLRNLATACRDYGLYVGDTGGGGLHADNSNKAAWTYVAAGTGVPVYNGTYTWDLGSYVNMASKLQVLA